MRVPRIVHLAIVCVLAVPAAAGMAPIKTVSHVHSAYSGGHRAPDMRATLALAHSRGIEAVIFADDACTVFEYGLWPLRNLLRYRQNRLSVLHAGAALYLDNIAQLRAVFPDMLIVPGVEAAPYYYWTGTPWRGLTINGWNRHMSVAGLESPRDYERLPILGNNRGFALRPLSLWPLLLLLFASALYLERRRRTALLLAVVGVIFLANEFPFRHPAFDQYASAAGWQPYEAVARYAKEKGALCFWNHPEASNWNERRLGWHVMAKTDPYPDCLQAVPQTDGFAALLEGDRTMTKPGRDWDQALLDYVQGRRDAPPWSFGELDYVGENRRGPTLTAVYMDVHASTRTVPALLQALKAGRFESISAQGPRALSLREWRVASDSASASSGETLHGAPRPAVHISLAAVGADDMTATVTLIRNGTVLFSERAALPFDRVFMDDPGGERRLFYRLEARFGANGALLSNPIFVFND
jgi:hypothetical protein